LDEPQNADVCIEDIAWSLSRQCRWGGHLKAEVDHYSVAQHCVLVSRLCDAEVALAGLLHDAAEAYLQDIISPLKRLLGPEYKRLEHDWNRRIETVFDCAPNLTEMHPSIKAADRVALETERRDVVCGTAGPAWRFDVEPMSESIVPWSTRSSYAMFLRRFEALYHAQVVS